MARGEARRGPSRASGKRPHPTPSRAASSHGASYGASSTSPRSSSRPSYGRAGGGGFPPWAERESAGSAFAERAGRFCALALRVAGVALRVAAAAGVWAAVAAAAFLIRGCVSLVPPALGSVVLPLVGALVGMGRTLGWLVLLPSLAVLVLLSFFLPLLLTVALLLLLALFAALRAKLLLLSLATVLIAVIVAASGSHRAALLLLLASALYHLLLRAGLSTLCLTLLASFLACDLLLLLAASIKDDDAPSTSAPPPHSTAAEGEQQGGGAGVAGAAGEGDGGRVGGEIERIVACKSHYEVLRLAPFCPQVDQAQLKKEYRRMAMLVHPDKHGGHEKNAIAAFQRLQNAYEVLSDEARRREYEAELRREQLVELITRRAAHMWQSSSAAASRGSPGGTGRPPGKGGGGEGAAMREEEEGGRQVACSECGLAHVWRPVSRPCSQARWCQECQRHHPCKEGDGWVEQFPQPALFGMLSVAGPRHFYTCTDAQVFRITEWARCQGLRCPPNTHKPSFHFKLAPQGPPPPASSASPRTQRQRGRAGRGSGRGREEREEGWAAGMGGGAAAAVGCMWS
ncbi:hypothetical protein CLOM_g7933 [Closterium sp. NIES-68]|nr:hypothetical protein CLOM_g7933 [Closterium sp. NIES-68]